MSVRRFSGYFKESVCGEEGGVGGFGLGVNCGVFFGDVDRRVLVVVGWVCKVVSNDIRCRGDCGRFECGV